MYVNINNFIINISFMGKIVNENGVLWLEEKEYASGIWHTHRKFLGKEEKKEDKPKKTKKEDN